jgi:hypothetical protein
MRDDGERETAQAHTGFSRCQPRRAERWFQTGSIPLLTALTGICPVRQV